MLCLLLHLCLLCFNIYHICSYETFVLPYFDADKGRMTILYFGEHITGIYGILSLTSQYTLLTNQSSYKRELSSSCKLNSVNQTKQIFLMYFKLENIIQKELLYLIFIVIMKIQKIILKIIYLVFLLNLIHLLFQSFINYMIKV